MSATTASDAIGESHKTAVGCSKIAQALGIGRFGSRYELWMMHTGRKAPEDLSDKLRVALGEPMEEVLRPFVAQRLGRDLRRDRKVYRHGTLPLIAHTDYRASKRDGDLVRPIVDMKTSLGFGARHRFGEDGSDEVDDDVMLQMQGYMMLTGAELSYVAALVPGPELKIYTIEADRELHELICDGVADYWRLVTTDTPPDPQSEAEARVRWSAHRPGVTVEADEELADGLRELKQLGAELKRLEDRKQEVRDWLIPRLGEAEVIARGGAQLATYRANKPSKVTNWETVANEYAAWLDDEDVERIRREHTKPKPGARVLRLSKDLGG